MADETRSKYCIVGAGSSGLAVAKNFATRGIPFDLLECATDIGGLWNIATDAGVVYETTHLVSAVSSTDWDDFKLPETGYPEYPSHALVIQYFRDYMAHFGVGPQIQFKTTVERVTPLADGTFAVRIAGEATPRNYKGVVVANGHHNTPRMPIYPGTFAGQIIHSSAYKSPRQLRDRRVLVVGVGNSGCDIIRDAAHGGNKVVVSMRRGTWFVPKFMIGFPTHDVVSTMEMLPVPRLVKRWIFQASLFCLQGPPSRYGLPDPDYPVDAAHPTMSDDVPRLAAHGRLIIKPAIDRLDGDDVVFSDGSREAVDLIVYATGYQPTLPFLDRALVFDGAGKSRLFLNVAHPEHAGLYFAGFVQANGSIWRLADYQGQIIANAIVAAEQALDEARAFRARASAGGGLPRGRFVASERHILETNYYDYRRVLRREAARFRNAGRLRYPPVVAATAEAKPMAAE